MRSFVKYAMLDFILAFLIGLVGLLIYLVFNTDSHWTAILIANSIVFTWGYSMGKFWDKW